MDDSLESLMEKATNPKNTYEDWEFIMAFCDRVNADLEGPQIALKLVVPKIRSDNDKVALLALTLLEACVKNCGQKFHQELGKFKFLNELIRMLSPKYLGEATSPAVKERIKRLLYSWKVGLPQEPKVNEAYLMLKREGLIFDESVGPDCTLQPEKVKPKVTLVEDPKQSQMLQKLLSSKNAEDLRAANRLIRDMVKRDEKRMQKVQQRLEDVELIQNNVKLLSELLSHYKDTSGEGERQLIDELYKSIEKLRPNLFRMASELKQNEEGMTDILQTNDSVLRVMDLYDAKFNKNKPKATLTTTSNGMGDEKTSGNTAEGSSASTGPSEGATAVTATTTVASGSEGQGVPTAEGGASGRSEPANALIDLADLNFDPTPVAGAGGNSVPGGASGFGASTGLGSLLSELGTLDLGTSPGGMPGMFPPANPGANPGAGLGNVGSQPPLIPFSSSSLSSQQLGMGGPTAAAPSAFNSSPSPFSSLSSAQNISSGGQPPLVSMPPPSQQQAGIGMGMGGMGLAPSVGSSGGVGMGSSPGAMGSVGGTGMNMGGPGATGSGVMMGTPQGQPPQVAADPLAVLDKAFVPLDSIKPGTLPSLPVVSKNSVTVTFHFAAKQEHSLPQFANTAVDLLAFNETPKNALGPDITIVVVSIISTSPVPVTNFQFQAAVPKVMRIKLQPPTGTDLAAYNPLLPPSSISQVMLLANPTKVKVRMKYRVSFQQNGGEVVEMGEVGNFPQSS